MKRLLVGVMVLVLAMAGVAQAVPELQLYVEGGTYDSATESWVISGGSFTLWVIGYAESAGQDKTPLDIYNVMLSAAVLSGETGSIALTPTTTGDFGGFTDLSTPVNPTYDGFLAGTPMLSDGTPLAPHGIYPTNFHQWTLGDFDLGDSPVADFITSFPTPTAKIGQINAYDVVVSGYSQVHFDAYNTVEGTTHAIFAPFSHDGGNQVPEPSTLLLLGFGLAGVGLYRRMKG